MDGDGRAWGRTDRVVAGWDDTEEEEEEEEAGKKLIHDGMFSRHSESRDR